MHGIQDTDCSICSKTEGLSLWSMKTGDTEYGDDADFQLEER